MFITKKERSGSIEVYWCCCVWTCLLFLEPYLHGEYVFIEVYWCCSVWMSVCLFFFKTIYGILTFMSFPALTYGSFPENFQSDPVRRQSIDVWGVKGNGIKVASVSRWVLPTSSQWSNMVNVPTPSDMPSPEGLKALLMENDGWFWPDHYSGQIIIFHQPRFAWNKGSHFPY